MKVSDNGIEFIKSEEGCKLHPYLDSASIPTIGFGCIAYPSGTKVTMDDPPISQTYADALLRFEANRKSKQLDLLLQGINVNQNQFDSLLSLSYNIGIPGLANSTVLKRVKANSSDPQIADAYLMWNKIKVNGKLVPNQGLASRRKREIALYFKEP